MSVRIDSRIKFGAQLFLVAFVALAAAPPQRDHAPVPGAVANPAQRIVLAEGNADAAVPEAGEKFKRAATPKLKGLDYQLLSKETPTDRIGTRHYEYSLQLKNPRATVFLAKRDKGPDGPDSDFGFNERSLIMEWVQEGRLLRVAWSTLPIGNGAYTMGTNLLVLKTAKSWDAIYRDTYRSHASWGASDRAGTDYVFMTGKKAGDLILRAEEVSSEYKSSKGLPLARTLENNAGFQREIAIVTNWPCHISEGKVVCGKGLRTLALGTVSFPIDEVVQYITETRKEQCDEAQLRRLNKQLGSSKVCSGVLVIDDHAPPHKPDEKHYYEWPG